MSKSKKRMPWNLGGLTPIHDTTSDKLDNALETAEKTGALNEDEVQKLLFVLRANPGDKSLEAMLQDALHPHVLADKLNPDVFRPYPDQHSNLDRGDFFVGRVNETNLQWMVPPTLFPHVAIVGPTRQGKSTLVHGLQADFHGRLNSLMLTPKTDPRRLLVDPPIVDRVIDFSELRICLFAPPPGADKDKWQMTVIERICLIWSLQYARSPALECVDELRKEFEALSKAQGQELNMALSNIKERLKQKKSKYAEGIATVLDLLIRSTGDVFECSQGMPVEDVLFSGSTILLIPNIADDKVARFIVDWIMEYAYTYFRLNGPDDGTPQLALILDDGHRFLSKSTEKSELTSLSHKYLVIKQSGVCIVAVSQCPNDLAETVLSQSAIVVQVGGFNHEHELHTMRKVFGLRSHEEDALRSIKQGEFVAIEQLGRYTKAFAGTVKRFPAPTMTFTEQDRRRLMAPLLSRYSWKAAINPSSSVQNISGVTSPPVKISSNALALAIDVLAYPYSFLNERYTRLGLQGRSATKVKQELVDQGWVREFTIPKHGGNPVLLEPLQPLAAGLHRPLPTYGKGGFLHWYMQRTVASWLKKNGYSQVQFEKFYGTKGVDLVGTSNLGQLEGFEITVSLSNVESNFVKDFAAQPRFHRITAVCISRSDAKKVKNILMTSRVLANKAGLIEVHPISHWL